MGIKDIISFTQECTNGKRTKVTETNKNDQNYLLSDINADPNVIYIFQPDLSNSTIVTMQSSNTHERKPANVWNGKGNFSNMTIMDVGAIQTIDQDTQAISS